MNIESKEYKEMMKKATTQSKARDKRLNQKDYLITATTTGCEHMSFGKSERKVFPNQYYATVSLNEIEEYINKREDFDVNVGVAVRIDKFSDSSIDMYVRCFTKTNSWNEMLSVKERLAIEIKQIVEKNKAAFAFPSQSIYIEKK